MPYLYIETAKQKLCRGGRFFLGGLCNSTYSNHGTKMGHHATGTVRVIFPEESTDAVIYVTVVVVFYAAIILILVGTNIRRFRNRGANSNSAHKRQLLVHIDQNERVYQETSKFQRLDPGAANETVL